MPRRGENIYKRKDGRWEGRYIKEYETDGKAKYGYVYAHSYTEVKARLPLIIRKHPSCPIFRTFVYRFRWIFIRSLVFCPIYYFTCKLNA